MFLFIYVDGPLEIMLVVVGVSKTLPVLSTKLSITLSIILGMLSIILGMLSIILSIRSITLSMKLWGAERGLLSN